MRRLAASFALAGVAFALGIGALELAVRTIAPQDLSGTWREARARGYLANRRDTIARHQRGDRVVRYRFDARGLRGGPAGSGRPRVLLVGDSYAFGWLLEDDHTLAVQLDRLCKASRGPAACEFLNGGVINFGLADTVAFVETETPALQPDAVLVLLGVRDVADSIGSPLFAFTGADQLEPRIPMRSDAGLKAFLNALPFYDRALEHSHLLQLVRTRWTRLVMASAPERPPSPSEMEDAVHFADALVRRIAASCRAQGIDLFVVTTGYERWQEPGLDSAFLAQAPAVFAREGVPFHAVDFGPGIDRAEIEIAGDGHPDERGSALLAERVWAWLEPRLRSE